MATHVVGDGHCHMCSNKLCHKTYLCTSERVHEGHIISDVQGEEEFRVVQFCSANCERDFFGYSMSDDEEPDDEEYECWPPKEAGDTLFVD